MKNFFYFFIIIYVFLFMKNAYAYLDPGTGGIILQAIVGALALVITYISIYWNKLKNFIRNIFKKKNKDS